MRLFLALELPDPWLREAARTLDALTAALGDDADVLRPVALDRMHVTVRFLGEVDEERVPVLDAALREVVPPVGVDLELTAAGTFGSAARTSVVWLGLGGDLDALRALAGRIESAVEAAGLPPERRELRPHVTLARVRRQASAPQRRAIAVAVAALDAPPAHAHRAGEVVLVRSHLGSGQPRYEVLGRY